MDNNAASQTQSHVIQIPPEIRAFLQSVLNDANMHPVDDVMQEAMIQEMFERLDKMVALKMVEELSDENLEEFTKLNEEKKTKEEVDQFFKEKVPNARDIFAKAFVEFRDIYLNNVEVVRDEDLALPSEKN